MNVLPLALLKLLALISSNGDWKAGLRAPPKDDRPQTEVRLSYASYPRMYSSSLPRT